MTDEPSRWLDRLVGACFSVLLGALALYAAVWLLRLVWVQVVICTLVAGLLVTAVWIFNARRNRW